MDLPDTKMVVSEWNGYKGIDEDLDRKAEFIRFLTRSYSLPDPEPIVGFITRYT